jgi:hypothetical protein
VNEHEKKPVKIVFCPLEQDVVETVPGCMLCRFFDNKQCRFYDAPKAIRHSSRVFREVKKMIAKANRRLGRRGGRRAVIPPEKWSRNLPNSEYPFVNGNGTEYGMAGFLAPDDLNNEVEVEEVILEEMTKEHWDVEPDVPDWISTPDSSIISEAGSLQDPLPGEPQFEPFPPGVGPGPENENFPGNTPGFPPDIPGPNLP